MKIPRFTGFLPAMLVLCAASAEAYVGPGPGFSMLGEFETLMAVVLVCLGIVLAVPMRFLIRKFRKPKPPSGE